MIPELGHFFLILALLNAVLMATIPFIGVYKANDRLIKFSTKAALSQLLLIAASYLCLTIAFVQNDFSVEYVAGHSNSLLPLRYRITAVWGAHEGSLLLWILILALWTYAVALFSKSLPKAMLARVLAVMGLVSIGFISFTLFTSNPFSRALPFIPIDGSDLNPVLQDFGLIIHPPMLYMGYVGFSVVFAFAIAGLLEGKLDQTWAKWSRPWVTIAWVFMTLGIMLGSWWAYYELGWGGWWFWDPVENASFLPWLSGTALIHSLAATEKRQVYKSWTVLLAIVTFSLSLLGTFMVRSGVLTSVHSFSNDPERGLYLLVFLAIVVGGALTLYLLQFDKIRSKNNYAFFSKEIAILLNNVLLSCALLVVFLGTVYPLIADAIWGDKVSIGPPFFNPYFSLFFAFVLLLMPIGQQINWKQQKMSVLLKQYAIAFGLALVSAFVLLYSFAQTIHWQALLGLALAMWVIFASFRYLQLQSTKATNLKAGLKKISRSYWGMIVAHIGVAVTVIGVVLTSYYSIEKDVRVGLKESVTINDIEIYFASFDNHQGDNYISSQATFIVSKDKKFLAKLQPEKRRYHATQMVMTEADIDPGFLRDIYIALGSPLEQGAWAVRVYYKPFVRWIWLGSILMALGGLLAISDKRYRKKLLKSNNSAESAKEVEQ